MGSDLKQAIAEIEAEIKKPKDDFSALYDKAQALLTQLKSAEVDSNSALLMALLEPFAAKKDIYDEGLVDDLDATWTIQIQARHFLAIRKLIRLASPPPTEPKE